MTVPDEERAAPSAPDATSRAPATTPRLSAIGDLVGRVALPLRPSRAEPDPAPLDELFPAAGERTAYVTRFSWLIVLSAAIAGFGLIGDSEAVVIGAMLVAPLMNPILAASSALVRAESPRLAEAVAVLVWGSVAAIAVGWLVALVAGGSIVSADSLPAQVVARTSPGLLDLGVAVAAGAAGGYVVPRRQAIAALPGVGIAVALVPPLATVGITLEEGATAEARGALLLYLTNLAAIVFSASIVLLASGYGPTHDRARLRVQVGLATSLLAVVGVAVPLTVHTLATVADNRLKAAVADAVADWDSTVEILSIEADDRHGPSSVTVRVAGPNPPLPAWQLAEQIRDRHGGPIDLTLFHEIDEVFEVSAR